MSDETSGETDARATAQPVEAGPVVVGPIPVSPVSIALPPTRSVDLTPLVVRLVADVARA